MVKLTVKQQRFADEYIRLGEITQAAINAGYSIKSARTAGQANMRKHAIKDYIDDRLQELKKESIAEQDEVLQYLTAVMRGKVKDEALLVVGDGDFGSTVERHEKRSDTMGRTKAAELLGKRYAMWTDRQQIDGETLVRFEYNFGDDDDVEDD